jgi:sugar O-acyltransferase (sialic acid O-acetyltransferase NeuD family)
MDKPVVCVLVIGAGGHGQVAADALMRAAEQGALLRLAGFLDDNPELWGQTRLGAPILGAIGQVAQTAHDAVLMGIGDNGVRQRLYACLTALGEWFVTVCHPSALVGGDVEIGTGTLVGPGVVVNTGSRIGTNVVLNSGSIVEHHCHIGDHVHIAPGARLGGEVSIGTGVLLGIGAIVLPGVHIGAWSTVGAGAVVTKDLPAHIVAVGMPARVVRQQEECRRKDEL